MEDILALLDKVEIIDVGDKKQVEAMSIILDLRKESFIPVS